MKFVLEKLENIVGIGVIAGYQHFLLFTKCFQKACLSRSLQVGIIQLRVKLANSLSSDLDQLCSLY